MTMIRKLLIPVLIVVMAIPMAAQSAKKINVYGFVRSDFFYNSRLNEETIDGVFEFFPKPVTLNADGEDINAIPNAEIISVTSRVGIDIKGDKILNADVSGKIEADFAGTGSTYFFLRIRQAYTQFQWDKTKLLIGQAWHPMSGTVFPTMVSLNTGAPFQPFNRSPQVRIEQKLSENLNFTSAAVYQMQYLSYGPAGASANYLKRSVLPNLFAGLEYKNKTSILSVGTDFKRIKPDVNYLHSFSAQIFGQHIIKDLQLRGKVLYGQNLSDHIMMGGYGVSGQDADGHDEYTNFNTLSAWGNIVYGKDLQVGVFTGFSQHLGSNKPLDSNIKAYGRGYYSNNEMLFRLVRISPFVSYKVSDLKFGLEFEFTGAEYGKLQTSGDVINPYRIQNDRILGSVTYNF